MRAWVERLAALAATAALGGALGWVCAASLIRGQTDHKIEQWQNLTDELENRWQEAEAELAKAMAANQKLHDSIGKVYDAGIIAGQTLQRDREEWGL